MTAGDLIGKSVVNQEGDEVGEIEDIVIGTSDKAVQAIVSVGGFLGIGDKSVAVAFDELQQQDEESVLLSSGATVEELKQRPAYDEASGAYETLPRDRTPADSGL
jgi:sporulation protein YlmC with PRC-barrel domain